MTRALFGRDPVMTVSVIVAFLLALLPAFGWSPNTVGAVSAALVALGGVVSALLLSVDRALPLLVGLGKAVIAAVASFGVHLPDNWVSAIMAVLTVVAGLATRPQVGAKEPPRDRDGNIVNVTGVLDAMDFPTDLDDQGPPRDAPPLPDTGSPGRVIDRGEFVTEVLPAVQGESPAEAQHREQESGRKGRHWLDDGWRPSWGQLRPDDGAQ